MTTTISNIDDVIDSRDVIARIEELQNDRELFGWSANEDQHEGDEEARSKAWTEANEDDATELAALLALQEEAEGYASDWKYGATLIADSYFATYAEELADDLGLIPKDSRWPATCIDWERAADELKQDYTSVDFDGHTFWVR